MRLQGAVLSAQSLHLSLCKLEARKCVLTALHSATALVTKARHYKSQAAETFEIRQLLLFFSVTVAAAIAIGCLRNRRAQP